MDRFTRNQNPHRRARLQIYEQWSVAALNQHDQTIITVIRKERVHLHFFEIRYGVREVLWYLVLRISFFYPYFYLVINYSIIQSCTRSYNISVEYSKFLSYYSLWGIYSLWVYIESTTSINDPIFPQQFWARKKSDKKFEAKTTSTDSNVNDRRSNFLLIMIQEIES